MKKQIRRGIEKGERERGRGQKKEKNEEESRRENLKSTRRDEARLRPRLGKKVDNG